MNPSNLTPFAQMAKDQARARRMLRFTTALVFSILASLFIGGLASMYAFKPTLNPPSKPPKPHDRVVAFTATNWYKAYTDENGLYHNAEDGLPLGTVIYWSTITHPNTPSP